MKLTKPFFLMIAFLSSTHSADGLAAVTGCGKPSYDANKLGIYLWQKCTTQKWRVHVEGSEATESRGEIFEGVIRSKRPIVWIDDNDVDEHDTLILSDDKKVLTFKLVVYGDMDGFEFKLLSGADVLFEYTGSESGIPLVVGQNNLVYPSGSKINLETISIVPLPYILLYD